MAPGAPEPLGEPLIHTPEDARSLKEDRSVTAASWQQEAKQQLTLAVPIMGMNAVQLMLVLTSAAFVGHLGALELASAQLATSLGNAMGHYLLVSVL
jgi:Na+-driven multidrug efflux pump